MTKKTYLEPITEIITVVNEQMLASLSLGDKTYSTTKGNGHGGGSMFDNIDDLDAGTWSPYTPDPSTSAQWDEIEPFGDKGPRSAAWY